MFDRGAPCKKYRGGMTAKVSRERCGRRSGRCGNRLAGSSENIRPAVAFAESYPIPFALLGVVVACSLRLPFFIRKQFLKEVKIK
jgi:hypothetical protein